MTSPIRVLVVDDSAVMRSLLRRVLSSEPGFEVAGVARDGEAALQLVRQGPPPDLVTLDVEMPVLDGLATLRELKRGYPDLPVVMLSALTAQGAAATVEALLAGADAYIQKPSGAGSASESISRVAAELLPKVRSLCGKRAPAPEAGVPAREASPSISGVVGNPSPGQTPSVLCIGCSTGGPVALREVLRALPPSFPLPIVVVQHMPPLFTAMLAKRLSSESPFEVTEGTDGAALEAGRAWLAPGDHHMVVERRLDSSVRIALNQGPQEHSCRPAVDVLFRSVAAAYGPETLAVVLTGMGYDGAQGCSLIRESGGYVLAQDEETSVVWGMPGAVANAGAAHQVLPLPELAPAIARAAKSGSSRGKMSHAS